MRQGEDVGSRCESRRRRSVWVCLALIATVLATAVGGSLVYLAHRSGARLRAAIADAERTDLDWRLTVPDAGREAVSDAENAALVVVQAVKLLPSRWPDGETPNVNDVLNRFEFGFDVRLLEPECQEILRRELSLRRPVVEVARAAVSRSRGRLAPEPREAVEFRPWGTEGSEAAWRLSRLLEIDVEVAVLDGRCDDAVASARTFLAVARAIGDEASRGAQLARRSIATNAARTMVLALSLGEPSIEGLVVLQRELLAERAQARVGIRPALRADRAAAFELLEKTLAASAGPIGFPRRILLTDQEAMTLEWMGDLPRIVNRPESDWHASLAAWSGRITEFQNSRLGAYADLGSLGVVNNSRNVLDASLVSRAEQGAAAILIAAERHRRATGAWPSSVAEIPADILPDPPLDPYSGRPYRIRRRGQTLRVYSIGENRRDEGGATREEVSGGIDDVVAIGLDVEVRGRIPEEDGDEPGR